MNSASNDPPPAHPSSLFHSEISRVAESFNFAANEGQTEHHNSPKYLQKSYDRYSRTVEDFLLVGRLLRQSNANSPAESADFRSFEKEVAQRLHEAREALCISENRLSTEGEGADADRCREAQNAAAKIFVELSKKLMAISSPRKQ